MCSSASAIRIVNWASRFASKHSAQLALSTVPRVCKPAFMLVCQSHLHCRLYFAFANEHSSTVCIVNRGSSLQASAHYNFHCQPCLLCANQPSSAICLVNCASRLQANIPLQFALSTVFRDCKPALQCNLSRQLCFPFANKHSVQFALSTALRVYQPAFLHNVHCQQCFAFVC